MEMHSDTTRPGGSGENLNMGSVKAQNKVPPNQPCHQTPAPSDRN